MYVMTSTRMCLAHLTPVSLGRMEENDKPAEQVRRVLFGKQPRRHGIIGDCMLPHIYSTFEANMSRNALEPERTAHIPHCSGEFRRGFCGSVGGCLPKPRMETAEIQRFPQPLSKPSHLRNAKTTYGIPDYSCSYHSCSSSRGGTPIRRKNKRATTTA